MSQLLKKACRQFGGWAAALLLLAGSATAQAPHRTRLVVWIVSNASGPGIRARSAVAAAQLPTEVQSQTAGTFGRTAGSVGTNAGDVGQTSGSFGQTAGSTGKNAGDAGQTAGSFGASASATGGNAGDAGRTMAEFGVSTTDLPAASVAANRPGTSVRPKRTPGWDEFIRDMEGLSSAELVFVDVFSNTLEASLAAVAGTYDAPDVLVGRPLPPAWTQMQRRGSQTGIAMVWNAAWTYTPHNESERVERPSEFRGVDAAILANAHNLQGAEALVARLYGVPQEFGHWETQRELSEPGKVAIRALNVMLLGGSPEAEADPEMARFKPDWFASVQNHTMRDDWTDRVRTWSDVVDEARFGSLAILTLRGVVYGPKAFGVVHALTLLRRDAAQHWHLLQMTPNMDTKPLDDAFRLLRAAEDGRAIAVLSEGTQVRGVSQAAPLDGASVTAQPQLWWDNFGGATFQVVEWQRDENGWMPSNLYFVPDANSRLRTQVQARFAASSGKYRWRVWSLGAGGALRLGPWRTMDVVAR